MNPNTITKVPYVGTLSFYRRLLKTMMKVFDGDYVMFHRSRIEARKKILENKDERDEVKIQGHIFFGEETREFLERDIIQANLQDSGRYRLKARKEHSMTDHVKPLSEDPKPN